MCPFSDCAARPPKAGAAVDLRGCPSRLTFPWQPIGVMSRRGTCSSLLDHSNHEQNPDVAAGPTHHRQAMTDVVPSTCWSPSDLSV
ncbi:hypothetical protein M3J09_003713 [Ascochyta lentis]